MRPQLWCSAGPFSAGEKADARDTTNQNNNYQNFHLHDPFDAFT